MRSLHPRHVTGNGRPSSSTFMEIRQERFQHTYGNEVAEDGADCASCIKSKSGSCRRRTTMFQPFIAL